MILALAVVQYLTVAKSIGKEKRNLTDMGILADAVRLDLFSIKMWV